MIMKTKQKTLAAEVRVPEGSSPDLEEKENSEAGSRYTLCSR
jgi:hypothetical protein